MNVRVLDIVRYFASSGKPLAAICHGPQVLAAAGVLKGKRCNAYPACAPDVTLAGGTFVELPMNESLLDGNLLSGPAWPALHSFLSNLLKALGTKIQA